MTDFIGWTPPPGAVVEPPVHPETVVDTFYSDGATYHNHSAGRVNWSAEGDGPRVVAYSVVEEYKPAPEPKEFWIVDRCEAYDNERDALDAADALRYKCSVIHVREVQPTAREVVAWALVDSTAGGRMNFWDEETADQLQKRYGGTVVKLTGGKP